METVSAAKDRGGSSPRPAMKRKHRNICGPVECVRRVILGVCAGVSALEAGSGADEGDEVGRVHGPPPLLGGPDELEQHPPRWRLQIGGHLCAVRGDGLLASVDGLRFAPEGVSTG